MFGRIIRLLFLNIVFVSGVLIGGVYTPEITAYSNAVNDGTKVDKQEIKPLRKKHEKRQHVV